MEVDMPIVFSLRTLEVDVTQYVNTSWYIFYKNTYKSNYGTYQDILTTILRICNMFH